MDQFPQKTFKIKEKINAKQEVHAHVRKLAEEAFPCVSLAMSHTDWGRGRMKRWRKGRQSLILVHQTAFVDPAKIRRGRKKKKKFAEACTRSYTDIWLQKTVTQLFCWTQRGVGGRVEVRFWEREDGGKDRTDELRNRRFTAPEDRPTSLSDHCTRKPHSQHLKPCLYA